MLRPEKKSEYLLRCRGNDLEMSLDVTAEYTCFEGFDMATDVCLRCQKVAFVHVAVLFLMSIWHNDASAESLHLKIVLTQP
jgi:hypothetical protein